MGCGSAPAPDPAIGQAALANAELAKEMAAVGREELAEGRRRYEEMKPYYTKLLDQQVRVADKGEERADAQWDDYESLFRPVEKRMVEDASAAGSAAEQEAAAGRAAGSVAQQFGVAGENARRTAMAYGVNPASARFGEIDRANNVQQAAAVAGASNTAREAEKTRGIAMRSGVAQFGRGMTQTGIASDSLALSGGNSAVGTAGAGTASRAAAVSPASGWMSNAVGANSSAGNLYLGQYGAQMKGYEADQAASGGLFGGLGQIAGSYAGSAAGSKAITAGLSMMSSKTMKTDRKTIADAGVLKKLDEIPVEQWKYKAGAGDGGTHIGPYAEDVNAQFGDKAAPGGKQIDMISMLGINLAAVKALAKKVEALEAA